MSVLPTEETVEVMLVYPFYRKGIVALKNEKAAGIDDVLVEQLKNLGSTPTSVYLIFSTNVSQKTRYQDCRDSLRASPY